MFLRVGDKDVSLWLVLAVVGGMAVVAFAVTVAVMSGRRSSDNVAGTNEVSVPAGRFDWIGVDDFVIEDELARGTEPRWIPFRPRRERWTETDVEEHWIDPREIGIEVLETRVNESIRQRLEDVP